MFIFTPLFLFHSPLVLPTSCLPSLSFCRCVVHWPCLRQARSRRTRAMTGSPGPGGRALVPWPAVWRWALAASLVAMMTLMLPGGSQACPPRCECSAQLRSVSCQRRRLTNIPEGIPTETQLLDLSKNRLRWVQAGDLAPYPRLEEVDLSENLIATLEPNAFATLQSLKVLKLRGNQLKLVPMGAFAKLGNLTSLDLSENKMVILLDYTFQDLRNLKHLEVGDNDLVYISHKVSSPASCQHDDCGINEKKEEHLF